MQSLIEDTKRFETGRALRWPHGVCCPRGERCAIPRQGRDDTQPERQRYLCQSGERRFDAWTDTIFAAHHHPRRVWIRGLSFMGLNLSHHPIASELDRHKDDVQQRTGQ